ncbi:putative uncharacterized protein FLJ39060 [Lemur catta]|uniref:putative uncharacterized protein FLJ39060 n=1 Tax=Lemur catta TaxID=9447 RepID=UPI001E2691B2|nr:putative uncharacterized protein FLJ39060 [Lemur catta]
MKEARGQKCPGDPGSRKEGPQGSGGNAWHGLLVSRTAGSNRRVLDGRTTNISDIFLSEPTRETTSPIVHAHSSLSSNPISSSVICRRTNRLWLTAFISRTSSAFLPQSNECIRHSASVPMATGTNGLGTKDETKRNAGK